MNENLEYNFLQNQLQANNQLRNMIQYDITTLSALIHQKRQWLDQLDTNEKEFNLRINALGDKNKTLIKYNNEI